MAGKVLAAQVTPETGQWARLEDESESLSAGTVSKALANWGSISRPKYGPELHHK